MHKLACRAPPPKGPVRGVRVRGGSPFAADKLDVPPSHPVWTQGEQSKLSKVVGVPLLLYRELPERSLNEPGNPGLDNQSMTYLMIELDNGFAPPRWQKNIGPVIVVRADQKPLTDRGLELFWMYADRILDVFGDDNGAARARAYYNPERFQSWCRTYREQGMENPGGRAVWEGVQLPL